MMCEFSHFIFFFYLKASLRTNLMLPIINTCDPIFIPLTPELFPGNGVIEDQVFSPTLFTSHDLRLFALPSVPPQTRFI